MISARRLTTRRHTQKPIALSREDVATLTVGQIGWGVATMDQGDTFGVQRIAYEQVYPRNNLELLALGGNLPGDSGGPALIVRDKKPYPVGIQSRLGQYDDGSYYSIETRVDAFHGWIAQSACDACNDEPDSCDADECAGIGTFCQFESSAAQPSGHCAAYGADAQPWSGPGGSS